MYVRHWRPGPEKGQKKHRSGCPPGRARPEDIPPTSACPPAGLRRPAEALEWQQSCTALYRGVSRRVSPEDAHDPPNPFRRCHACRAWSGRASGGCRSGASPLGILHRLEHHRLGLVLGLVIRLVWSADLIVVGRAGTRVVRIGVEGCRPGPAAAGWRAAHRICHAHITAIGRQRKRPAGRILRVHGLRWFNGSDPGRRGAGWVLHRPGAQPGRPPGYRDGCAA